MRAVALKAEEADWLHQAVLLAHRGEGFTRPNPPVGAIVVKAGVVVGRGWHRAAGTAHAEILALRQAGKRARGATLYVTLEPCCTQGRTGPCTEAIQASGIRRVIIGVTDPNPRHRGRGAGRLRRLGLEVVMGDPLGEAARLIEPFAAWITEGRSFVTLKLAVSLDGRIADGAGCSRWITGPQARAAVQGLRRRADVVMVGVQTALADDPALTSRTCASQPLRRLILDSRGRLPLSARVLTDGQAERTIIATTRQCPLARRQAYAATGADVWLLPARDRRVALAPLLRRVAASGYLHLLCEGGGRLAGALLRAQAVDSLLLFQAPLLLGSEGLPAVAGRGWSLATSPRYTLRSMDRLGDDLCLELRPRAGRVEKRTAP